MNKQSYDEARSLAKQANGPLGPSIRDFFAILIKRGYVGRTVYAKIYRAADIDRWLDAEHIGLSAVDEQCVARYHARDSGCRLAFNCKNAPVPGGDGT